MKLIKLLVITALAAYAIGVFANNDELVASCPSGAGLQFHQLATKYVGYWTGNTSDGVSIESENMSIPYQIFNDGYTVQFNNEIAGQGFITCVYYLQDNITGVKTPVFKVSSTIHH